MVERRVHLGTTQAAEFQPHFVLGKPLVEAYDTLMHALGTRDPALAAVFAEPVINPATGETSWYCETDAERVVPLTELAPAARAEADTAIADVLSRMQAEAATLRAKGDGDSLSLAESLEKMLDLPGEDRIFVAGGQPVFVNWGHSRRGETAPRHVLKTIAAQAAAGADRVAPPHPQADPQADPQAATEAGSWVLYTAPAARRSWLLAALLWGLTLLAVLAALWLALIHCALGWPGGDGGRGLLANYCPAPRVAETARSADSFALEDRLRQLELDLARRGAACLPPAQTPLHSTPQDRAESPPAASDVAQDVQDRGGRIGSVNVVLRWQGPDDLDLHLLCPDSGAISFRQTEACGGELDVDMNAGGRRSDRPVENIVFDPGSGQPGRYRVRVTRYTDNPPSSAGTPFEVDLLIDGARVDLKRGIASGRDGEIVMEFDLPRTSAQ